MLQFYAHRKIKNGHNIRVGYKVIAGVSKLFEENSYNLNMPLNLSVLSVEIMLPCMTLTHISQRYPGIIQ